MSSCLRKLKHDEQCCKKFWHFSSLSVLYNCFDSPIKFRFIFIAKFLNTSIKLFFPWIISKIKAYESISLELFVEKNLFVKDLCGMYSERLHRFDRNNRMMDSVSDLNIFNVRINEWIINEFEYNFFCIYEKWINIFRLEWKYLWKWYFWFYIHSHSALLLVRA